MQLSLKNYELAAKEYQVAYQFFSEDDKRNPSVLVQKNAAACLANLGVVMRFLNKNDQSLAYLDKAKNTYINLFATVKDSFLRVYAANCVFESGNTWAGTRFTNEQINRNTNNNTSQYERQGTVKNLAVALKYYDEALRLFGNIQSPYAVECWKARGTVLEKMNRGEEALQSYQNAIGVLLVKENNVLKTADVSDLIAPELLDAFAAKARILPKIHANLAGFHATFETLNKCDTLISRLMITYDADNSKYFLAEKAQPIYAQAIEIAYQLSQNTTIEKARFYQNAAFNFCEKNKAIVLLDNLKDQKAKHFGGIPDTLLAAECNLKADIAFAEKQLYDAPDSLKTTCKNAIFTAKQVFLNFQKQLEIDFPTYYNLKFQSQTPLSISESAL